MITVVTIINSNFFPCVIVARKKKLLLEDEEENKGKKMNIDMKIFKKKI